jgi:hypothetical protein
MPKLRPMQLSLKLAAVGRPVDSHRRHAADGGYLRDGQQHNAVKARARARSAGHLLFSLDGSQAVRNERPGDLAALLILKHESPSVAEGIDDLKAAPAHRIVIVRRRTGGCGFASQTSTASLLRSATMSSPTLAGNGSAALAVIALAASSAMINSASSATGCSPHLASALLVQRRASGTAPGCASSSK